MRLSAIILYKSNKNSSLSYTEYKYTIKVTYDIKKKRNDLFLDATIDIYSMNLSTQDIIVMSAWGSLIILATLSLALNFNFSHAQLTDNLPTSNPNTINLEISNITLGSSATDLISVDGIVLNNSTENVENLKIDVIIYDANNNTIRETSRFISSPFTIYEPASTENFSFLLSTNDFHNYTANAYADIAQ